MTDYLPWDRSKYTVNVDAMDHEHEALVALMNKLYARHSAGATSGELERVLDELGAATVRHFASEERYLESIKYSGLATHKLIHRDLLTKFQAHSATFKRTRKLDDELFRFLRSWLTAHIQGIDRKYGAPAGGIAKSA